MNQNFNRQNGGGYNRSSAELNRKNAARARADRQKRQKRFFQTVTFFSIIVLLLVICVSVTLSVKNNRPADEPSSEVIASSDDASPQSSDDPVSSSSDISSPSSDLPQSFITPASTEPPVGGNHPIICIDPGHGFYDNGTSSEFLGETCEKDITFDIAKRVQNYLIGKGYNCVLSHDGVTIPKGETAKYLFNPPKRAEYVAAHPEFDYFVSIHCNSYGEEYVSGTRIYYCDINSPEKTPYLADAIAKGITASLPQRKAARTYAMKEADAYYILSHISIPSVIIETDFVTNKEAATLMLSAEWRQSMAEGIANGIINYLK
ncbi:MAG: N-acetylmuramoyl-L-alanine amidase [Clostridia bacterium]|nr:N-acetylmuramoyl-L-alanine amidase [Clostridia bacterium]